MQPSIPRSFVARVHLKKVLFVIPNALTAGTLFFGFLSVFYLLNQTTTHSLYQSSMAIFFAAFFDLFDGRVARLTKTQSAFGTELDSLADLVSFGVAPALLLYRWGLDGLGGAGLFVSFFYLLCGAIRLARFNVLAQAQANDNSFFVGLPIPLAALLIASLVLTHTRFFIAHHVEQPFFVFLTGLCLSILMVSTIPYWSFKYIAKNPRNIILGFAFFGLLTFFSLRASPGPVLVILVGSYILAGLMRFFYLIARSTMGWPLA